MKIERRIPKGIWRIKEQDYKSASTYFTKKKEKFRIETDILGYAIKEVLFQEQKGK